MKLAVNLFLTRAEAILLFVSFDIKIVSNRFVVVFHSFILGKEFSKNKS